LMSLGIASEPDEPGALTLAQAIAALQILSLEGTPAKTEPRPTTGALRLDRPTGWGWGIGRVPSAKTPDEAIRGRNRNFAVNFPQFCHQLQSRTAAFKTS
jgi:hypothetical protein